MHSEIPQQHWINDSIFIIYLLEVELLTMKTGLAKSEEVAKRGYSIRKISEDRNGNCENDEELFNESLLK